MTRAITAILMFAGIFANYTHYAYFEASADEVWATLRKLEGTAQRGP